MNSKWKSAIGCLFIIFAFLYILNEFFFAVMCGFGVDPPSKVSEVAHVTSALNRAQQIYWFEYQKFASNKEELESVILLESENRKYSIEAEEKAVFILAFANISNADLCRRKMCPILSAITNIDNNPTHTFSSAVFALDEDELNSIICISNTPGWQKSNKPYLQDGEPVCGEGTTKYR